MYYGYPQMQSQQQEGFSWTTGVYIGVGIAIAVILVYIYFAYNVYRYSAERVGDKLLSKFKLAHADDDSKQYEDDDRKFLANDGGVTNSTKTSAYTNILVKDKVSQAVLSMTSFSASIRDDCAPSSSTCIAL